MDSIISTFHIDWKIIVAQAINFAIVFVVLYVYALKPLSKLMAERSEKISKGLDDAKTNALLLSETQKKNEEMLLQARKEAHDIFQAGKTEAEAKKNEMLDQAKVDVSKMIEDGKKVLESEKTKMVSEAKNEIVSLVISATEKLLGHKLDADADHKVIKELEDLK